MPTVSLTSPTNGAFFQADQQITLEATASDQDGWVTQVEFFTGDVSLGTASETPFSLDWLNASVGIHELTAIATDNEGGETVSAVVTIEVRDQTGGSCSGLLDYPQGIGSYQPGQQIQNANAIYEVREHPYGGWANIDAPYYYEPGLGVAWEDAWYHVGSCQ